MRLNPFGRNRRNPEFKRYIVVRYSTWGTPTLDALEKAIKKCYSEEMTAPVMSVFKSAKVLYLWDARHARKVTAVFQKLFPSAVISREEEETYFFIAGNFLSQYSSTCSSCGTMPSKGRWGTNPVTHQEEIRCVHCSEFGTTLEFHELTTKLRRKTLEQIKSKNKQYYSQLSGDVSTYDNEPERDASSW